MKIYIPTRGRTETQPTLESLRHTNLFSDVIVVAPKSEHKALRKYGAALWADKEGISATRQSILEKHRATFDDPALLMLDDDLSWRYRLDASGKKYPPCKVPKILEDGFASFAEIMNGYAHGSIGVAQFCTGRPLWTHNARMLRALAYNVRLMPRGCKFRIPVMEDFDMALQLFTQGFESVTFNGLVQDQRATNSPGGCSLYRTPSLQAAAAAKLSALWPRYVTVVQKQSKNWEGFTETRTDVRVAWRRACNDADK